MEFSSTNIPNNKSSSIVCLQQSHQSQHTLSRHKKEEKKKREKNSQHFLLNLCVERDCLLISWFVHFMPRKNACITFFLIPHNSRVASVCFACVQYVYMCACVSYTVTFFSHPPLTSPLPVWLVYVLNRLCSFVSFMIKYPLYHQTVLLICFPLI